MAEVNKCILIGRLTRDPEIRHTQGGMKIANFTVAVGSRRRDQNTGEWVDGDTLFMDSNAFDNNNGRGGLASIVESYLCKGCLVYVEGRLKQEKWVDKQTGQNRSKIVLNVNQLQILTPKKEREGVSDGGHDVDCQTQAESQREPEPVEEEIPF